MGNDKQTDKAIVYGVGIVAGYFVVQSILPVVIAIIVGLLIYRFILKDKFKL